jgi:arsenate reductase
MIVIYGLKNCDSCRKAVKLLAAGDRPFGFHDLRADGVPPDNLSAWLTAVGWKALLNRQSTTWRQLPDAEKADLGPARAAELLARHPTLIKRPVVEAEGAVIVGFAAPQQATLRRLAGS